MKNSMGMIFLCLFLIKSFSCASQTKTEELLDDTEQNNHKILIVYLSRTKNTKAVAEIIHQEVGGTLVALELELPYPEDYNSIVEQVTKEKQTGFLPPLKTAIDGIEQFEVVFMGFPTWGMQIPPPMKRFMDQYDLGGKTIVPFNTNAGYGIGSGFRTVAELCPNSTILDGYSTTGGIERDGILYVMEGEKLMAEKREVLSWLKNINMAK